jgi:hypothetical protein
MTFQWFLPKVPEPNHRDILKKVLNPEPQPQPQEKGDAHLGLIEIEQPESANQI